jgi:hypothetical protein
VRWNTTTRKQVHRTAGAPGNVVFLSALDRCALWRRGRRRARPSPPVCLPVTAVPARVCRADDTRVCSVGGEGPVHVWLKSAASCGPAAVSTGAVDSPLAVL